MEIAIFSFIVVVILIGSEIFEKEELAPERIDLNALLSFKEEGEANCEEDEWYETQKHTIYSPKYKMYGEIEVIHDKTGFAPSGARLTLENGYTVDFEPSMIIKEEEVVESLVRDAWMSSIMRPGKEWGSYSFIER